MINLSAGGGHFESASYRDNGCRSLSELIKRTSSVFVLMGRLSTDKTDACCVTAYPLGRFNITEVTGWNKTKFLCLIVCRYTVWITPCCTLRCTLCWTCVNPSKKFKFSEYSPLLPFCGSVLFNTTLQPYSCPSPGAYVYSCFLSPCCEAEIRLLECVACHTSRLRHCFLTERSVRRANSATLPLSDHWPRRHVWFIDLTGENKLGRALICFRGLIVMGTLRKAGDW